MKRLVIAALIGAFAGGAITTALFVLLFIHEREEKYQEGLGQGRTDGALRVFDALRDEFGEYKDGTPSKKLMGVKDCSILVIEERGVKTVRVQ